MKAKSYILSIENFLTIEKLNLDLSPGVTGLVGDNAQGKTNILTAIESILDGSHDLEKIRDGQEKSEIRLSEYEEDKLVASVSRIQTQKGNRLTGKGLEKGVTPKSFLDKLLDKRAINPLKLISGDIVGYIKQNVSPEIKDSDIPKDGYYPFDLNANAFEECEKQAEQYEITRLATYQELKRAKEICSELLETAPALPEKMEEKQESVDADRERVKKQIHTIEGIADKYDIATHRLETLTDKHTELENRITDSNETEQRLQASIERNDTKFEKAIANLKERHEKANNDIKTKISMEGVIKKSTKEQMEEIIEEIGQAEKAVENSKVPSSEKLNTELAEIENRQAKIDRYKELQIQHAQIAKRKHDAEEIEKRYNFEDQLYKTFAYEIPKLLIDRCELPVKDLAFRDQKLYVGNRHIDRLSSAQRAIVASEISFAFAKQRGHIAVFIDEIQYLDFKHKKEFHEAAEKAGIRVCYTRCGKPEHPCEREIVNGKPVKRVKK